ncbi:ABC transporter permease [Butyrivibrio sp. MC2013]|uniref:ABC transporter permease n=1 Tax=Butyrivibrio sp. MC2013 TaxID=1280686 RepID=UPI0003FB978C|nr:ABC transporter permease [Butyrivibrio sp. MC2013]
MKSKLSKLSQNQAFWPVMIFLAIILFNTIMTGGEFLKITIVDGHFYGRIIDIFRNGGKLMILAAGMTMVLATGGTDISVGSVMAISGAIACSVIKGNLLPGLNGSVAMAIILAVCAGILCGLWNGFLVSKIKIQPIVATMILLVAGRGIAQLITNGKIITITSDAYYFINGGYILGLPFPLYIVIFLVGLLLIFVTKTAFGLFLESIGCNPLASKFAGIKVDIYLLAIYTISGAFASVAGLIESAGIKGADCNNAGLNIELDAILAVAIGGTNLMGGRFSIFSSVIGALIVQSITTTVLALGVPAAYIRVLKAVLIIVICLSQSSKFKLSLGKMLAGKRKEAAAV